MDLFHLRVLCVSVVNPAGGAYFFFNRSRISSSRTSVRGGAAGAGAGCLRWSLCIAETSANTAAATIVKLITVLMKTP